MATVTGAAGNIDSSKEGPYLRPGAGTEPSVPGCGGSGSEASCERVVAGQEPIRDGDLTPSGHAELLPEHVAMRLRRPRRDAQPLPDLVVRETLCDQLDDLALPIGDLQFPLVQYLCHVADANNGSAACTLAERRIRVEYARLVAMARLIYTAICSLDGFVADNDGKFDWAEPDAEVHTFINDLERSAGTHLYGRRLYEVLVAWETIDEDRDQAPYILDFAKIWQAADKIVYSRTLETVSSARTRIERDFDPDAVRELKATSERDLIIGGPELAAEAIRAGLVDEYHLFLAPVVVGDGKRALPEARVDLELLDERRFAGGFVHLRYRRRS